jgi:hypothetical protein
MATSELNAHPERVYRIDRLTVPAAARGELLEAVRGTHRVLRRQAGFVSDRIVEKPAGPGVSTIITIAEWENASVVDTVRKAVEAYHREIGFDREAFLKRLGITLEIGLYSTVRD